jgi:uncharacterized protein (TIGR04141 family)
MADKKKLQQVKILLLKDALTDIEATLKEDGDQNRNRKYPLASNVPFKGAAYIPEIHEKSPDWLPFLNTGLVEPQDFKTATASAIVLLETPGGHRFAVTFGYGRFLVDPSSYVRDFGMRVALKSVDRIRSIDMRRVEGLTLHTRRMASKASKLPTFGVNKRHDLIQSIAGLPTDENFGKRLEGSDAFTLASYIDFNDLAELCDQLYELYSSDDLPEEFGFIDNFRVVNDPDKMAELNATLEKALQEDDLEKIHLAQPEAESLADINYYKYGAGGSEHLELEVEDMVTERRAAGLTMNARGLMKDYVYISYGHQAGHDLAKWPLYDCIVFETEDADGAVYMLSAGEWHRASAEFMDVVESQLASVGTSDINFPEAFEGEWEKDYNERAAGILGCQCAHGANINLPNYTPIELCDLVTDAGQFVHIKRKNESATLSHLFNQGLVSAEMLLEHRPFRAESRAVLGELAPGLAELVPLETHDPGNFEIVYGVIAKPGTALPDRLPLFSKITLADVSDLIHNMGFKVSIALVPTVSAAV